MSTRHASLSLDLDNLWSYLKTHGDAGWQAFPSYFDTVVPRFLGLLDATSTKITVFVVGQDAALDKNGAALRAIVEAGHEIGNHSFNHEPWLHLYAPAEVAREIERAEEAIRAAMGVRTVGFRGPGYSLSETVLQVLKARGYAYDCSTFPTIVGPLARAYYFAKARLEDAEKKKRDALFGSYRDGFRPVAPYLWDLDGDGLIEIPVTTMPFARVPIHFSYLHWIAGASETLASAYFASALRTCDIAGVAPSLLLHPLDFLGCDDVRQLAFFPGMSQTSAVKMRRMERYLGSLADRYAVEPMIAHANRLHDRPLPRRQPDFGPTEARRKTGDQTGLAKR